jgi:hypothetical protein
MLTKRNQRIMLEIDSDSSDDECRIDPTSVGDEGSGQRSRCGVRGNREKDQDSKTCVRHGRHRSQ